MESKFYDNAFQIDILVKKYSSENLDKIESCFKYEGMFEYFFKKIATSPNPHTWLIPLKEKGYFNPEHNPEPQEVPGQPGFYTIPHWNVLDYLENVANKNATEPSDEITNSLVEIVNAIINDRDEKGERVDNYRTDWFMLKIVSTFPIEKIEEQHIEFIKDALNSRWKSTLVSGGIAKTILPKLIKHEAKDLILKLIDVMFNFQLKERETYSEYQSVMEDYWLADALKKSKSDIIKLCGVEAADIAINKMKLILGKEDSQFSNMWIPAIEDHPQNRHADKYECQMVHFIRDAYEQSEAGEIRDEIIELLDEKHPIFKRIAIHEINHYYFELHDLFWNWDGNPLDEYGLKHEIYELLKTNCKSFTEEQVDKLIEWIESKDYYVSDEIKDDYEKKNIVIAYRKREWLSAVLDADNEKVNEKYKKYEAINSSKLDHPGFDYWMETGWGYESPISSEMLCAKTNSEIADYLKEFKPEKGWRAASEDGLTDAFRDCISNNPEKFVNDLEPFFSVQRRYQHSLFWGLWEAWRNKKSFEWDELLGFILQIIKSDVLWKEEYEEERYNYRNSIIAYIAELINDGTKEDSNAFNPELLPVAERILLILVEKTESSLHDMGDLITSVLNSTKGKIFVAMINYSLRCARLYKKDEKERWVDSIKNDFEKRLDREYESSLEFSVILGEYLPNLYYLSKDWVTDNLNSIFLKDDETHWKAAFSGYLFYASAVYEEIYGLLRRNEHYIKAIKTDFKDDHVSERLVQHICLGYLNGWENLDDEKSLLTILLENKKPEQLSEIVSFFWMQWGNAIEKSKIKALWKAIFDIASQDTDKEAYKNIISGLSKWLSLIDEIDDEIFEWLKVSAKYVEVDHNTSLFVEYLAKHVDNEPEKAGNLYLEMLNSDIYPDYQNEEISNIVETLYKKGEKKIADRICNRYGEKGYHFDFLRKLYEQFK